MVLVARNIILFSLLIDDTDGTASKSIWNIYYHLYLDDSSLQLLDSQAQKLLSLSGTLQAWNDGRYGRILRFCDRGTFAKVKTIWAGYTTEGLAPQDKSRRHDQHEANIQKARAVKERFVGESVVLSGVRSAAPAGVHAMIDLPTLHNSFWKDGITGKQSGDGIEKPIHPNPFFASSQNPALTLHYGLDPLLGFHLATAYAPLTSNSPLCLKSQQNSSSATVVEAARLQLREWSQSFRRSITNGTIVRFFSGDAIAFCHTLQQASTAEINTNANLYCHSWTFEPLKLDAGDYDSSIGAPTKFDVIDTSNLVDHLGPLNMLIATVPLLTDLPTSTLYTEVLVQHEASLRGRIDNILCGHVETISLLLGIASVESWTNATAVAEVDEGLLNAVSGQMGTKPGKESTQLRTRLCWKPLSALLRRYSPSKNSTALPTTNLEIEAQGLSRLLNSIYQAMFCHEDVRTLMANMGTQGIQKLSNPYYTRASFAALLKYVRSAISVDWDKTLKLFLDELERDGSELIGRSFLQELHLHLHLSGIHTVRVLQDGAAQQMFNLKGATYLSSWGQVPPVLCITFEVPRLRLKPLTEKPLGELGTPSLCCTVQSSRVAPSQWSNMFSAVQAAFGSTKLLGGKRDADFRVEVIEDASSWAGKSPLVVSFFIPTWILLQEPRKAIVACGLQITAHATVSFAKALGPELRIFETNLGDDDKVHITKYMPNLSAYPKFMACSSKPNIARPTTEDTFKNTTLVNLGADGSQIVGLTCKIDFISSSAKAKLSDKSSPVEVGFDSPMVAEIVVGKTLRCKATFPTPVAGSRSKLRIARKSSYVEVIVPILRPLDKDGSPKFMFPLFVTDKMTAQTMALPVNWNMPYVTLNVLPDLDIRKTEKLQWLITHTSLMFSSRERKIRDARMAGQSPSFPPPDVRVDFKDGLFSILMQYSGLQGERAQVFGLHKKGTGGVHVILFVSALKLDLVNHTVILDTAVLPLSHNLLGDSKIQKCIEGLQSVRKFCIVNVTDTELQLWKQLLPALAERCRTWKHKPESCAYLSTGEVPTPKGLDDGNTPLCSCGNGHLPPKFMGDLRVPYLDYVLQKYVTRIAISPVFAVPYVEDCFLSDMPSGRSGSQDSAASPLTAGSGCNTCGSNKRKPSDGASEALLTCVRCKLAKYCSKECQRADWKEHKGLCVAA
jgi:MYND finger